MIDQSNQADPPALSYANAALDHRANRFTFEFHGNVWIQLLVVMLLVLGLVWLLLPATSGGGRSPRVACMANLRQIGVALHCYAQEHEGYYPPTIAEVVDYTGQQSFPLFVCPAGHATFTRSGKIAERKHDLLDPTGRYCSYLLDVPGVTESTLTAKHVVLHECADDHPHGGINVVFGDGSVQAFDGAEAQHLLTELAAGRNPPRPFSASTSR